jgi:hypothetical protein
MGNKQIIAVVEQRATHIGIPKLRIPEAMLMQIVNYDGIEDPSDYTVDERQQMKNWNVRIIIEAEPVKGPAYAPLPNGAPGATDAEKAAHPAILGWLNPDTGKTCSADEKHSMVKHQGMPGLHIAKGFSIPLVAAALPHPSQVPLVEQITEENRQGEVDRG